MMHMINELNEVNFVKSEKILLRFNEFNDKIICWITLDNVLKNVQKIILKKVKNEFLLKKIIYHIKY